MKVKELKECDIQLTDITEEEWNAMFLEGVRELVRLARENSGKDGNYFVLPYTPELEKELGECKNKVEIDDADVNAFVQIGAVSMIIKGIKDMENNNEDE